MSQKITSPFGGYYIYPDDSHNLFQQLLGHKPAAQRETSRDLIPEVDIFEDESAYYASIEMPGVEKSDLGITCTDNTVTINAKVERSEHQDGHWVQHERRTGTYVRSIQFRVPIAADDIGANYEAGILNLKIPKRSPDQKTVSISVE